MDPSIRSRLCDRLAQQNRTQDWPSLLADHGTPLLVLDPNAAVTQYQSMRRHLPGVRMHYAVKSLPHPAVLTALAAVGACFDVATRGEIDQLVALGIPMSRCVYTHPIKKPADISHAHRAGIRRFVVDNLVEAAKFATVPADAEVLVRLAFRNPDAKSDLSAKFGVDIEDAPHLVEAVVASGVELAGFTFHVGSQGSSSRPFGDALRATLDLIDEVESSLELTVRVLDIGGGFPVAYREEVPTIAEIGDLITGLLAGRHADLTVLAEPGRIVSAPCMTLLTSVVGTAVRENVRWHHLDDGLYGSYSNVMTEDVHPPILALSEIVDRAVPTERVTLAGPSCDSRDVIVKEYPLPALSVGDVLVSPMMGAYTSVSASGFNGIAATPIVIATGARDRPPVQQSPSPEVVEHFRRSTLGGRGATQIGGHHGAASHHITHR